MSVMFFPFFIKWLSHKPAPFALGLLWWGELTVYICSIAGGYLVSNFIRANIKSNWENALFPLAMATYFLVFYLIMVAFGKVTLLMEALIHIHRMGGPAHLERLQKIEEANKNKPGEEEAEEISERKPGLYEEPKRIRASSGVFTLRYLVLLPTVFILYLMSFASTIYKIFTRQLVLIEPGLFVTLGLIVAIVVGICYWQIMRYLPGYVDIAGLMGNVRRKGE